MILDKIVRHKQKEVLDSKTKLPEEIIKRNLPKKERGCFKKALAATEGISLIAEVKKASPSKGIFRQDFNPAQIAGTYEKAGAAAISVLTDSRFFQGGIQDLKTVKQAVSLPVLRKDFIIDPYQIYESLHIGADAILFITAILEERQLKSFISIAGELGLDALVEVHSREDLSKAVNCGAEIIGINNRDLTTFTTDIATTLKLMQYLPEHCTAVSESGIFTRKDVRRLEQAGVDAILVGEALVTSSDIDAKIRQLLRQRGC